MSFRLFAFTKTLLVYLLLGPPIGALVFMGTLAVSGLASTDGGTAAGVAWVLLFALIYAVPLSYLIGTLPAAIVGTLIGAYQVWRGPVGWWLALAIGLAAGLWLFWAGGGPLPSATEANPERRSQLLHLVTLMATCLVPTMACWLIARRWAISVRLAPPV